MFCTIRGPSPRTHNGDMVPFLYVGPLDRPRRLGVPFGPLPLPVMIDGGGAMGSVRDSSPEPRRAGSPMHPSLFARPRLHPASAITPLAASTPGRTPRILS